MSVEFYHSRSAHGRMVPFEVEDEGTMAGYSCSYSSFTMARLRICAHFSPRASVLWSSLYLMRIHESEIVSLCEKFVPAPVRRLLFQPDCEGFLTPKQCQAILNSLKKHLFDDHEDVQECVVEYKDPFNGKSYNNWHLNDNYYKCVTRYLVKAMKHSVAKNRYLVWS